jgi:NTE family protein
MPDIPEPGSAPDPAAMSIEPRVGGASPVDDATGHASRKGGPSPGVALCMSGGGFRAMLFHVGVLWRLNELRWLRRLNRISSVSGGSITAGTLALAWPKLNFDANNIARRFEAELVVPIRTLATTTLDTPAVIGGILSTDSIAEKVAHAYDETLFHGQTLQDLPDEAADLAPRFVINASNVQSGALFRFSKPYIWDWRVGKVENPTLRLSLAVAASSAFPPVLSPLRLHFEESDFTPGTGADLQRKPFTTEPVLTDGGVYDNLGLETAWKRYRTILVSDAGGKIAPDPDPETDWLRHTKRVLELVDNQVRSLRKRQVLAALQLPRDAGSAWRDGAYFGIRTDITHYGLADALPCPHDKTMQLAAESTRLARIDDRTQERIINWGYAACDAAMRRWVIAGATVSAPKFPYERAGVG